MQRATDAAPGGTASPLRLVLLGKQGAGKGTQGELLAERFAVPSISTGEVFRDAVRQGTPLGRRARRFIDRGELVPDDIVIGLVRDALPALSAERGFVLDGFPRTVPQAEELESLLLPFSLDAVVDLEVATDVALRRIAGRRVCVQCGRTYHVDAPPTSDWTCDTCGGHVVQRDDDTEEAVLRRLELYEAETAPLIEFYRARGQLLQVDGDGDTDDVFHALLDALEERLACRS